MKLNENIFNNIYNNMWNFNKVIGSLDSWWNRCSWFCDLKIRIYVWLSDNAFHWVLVWIQWLSIDELFSATLTALLACEGMQSWQYQNQNDEFWCTHALVAWWFIMYIQPCYFQYIVGFIFSRLKRGSTYKNKTHVN